MLDIHGELGQNLHPHPAVLPWARLLGEIDHEAALAPVLLPVPYREGGGNNGALSLRSERVRSCDLLVDPGLATGRQVGEGKLAVLLGPRDLWLLFPRTRYEWVLRGLVNPELDGSAQIGRTTQAAPCFRLSLVDRVKGGGEMATAARRRGHPFLSHASLR